VSLPGDADQDQQDNTGAVAQSVRVPVCHTGGREFESRQPRSPFFESEVVRPVGPRRLHQVMREGP
jgi:hypothetical protein